MTTTNPAGNPARTDAEEALMPSSITITVRCPMHAQAASRFSCGAERVEVVLDYKRGEARYAACSSLQAQGWGDEPQLVTRLTDVDRYVDEPAAMLRHRDGLVWLGA